MIAYSGGVDSAVLLSVIKKAAFNLPIRAVHVCHHIYTPETEQWARHCEQFCQHLAVPFTRLDVEVKNSGQGLEAAARRARYAALYNNLEANEILVLAHHAKDQAETFLMNALRGSGIDGLAAMPKLKKWGGAQVWRPFLNITRAQILDYAKAHCLHWVDDPSNNDPQVKRGYLATQVWPVLYAQWPGAEKTLARTAEWAGQASQALIELAQADLHKISTGQGQLQVRGLAQLSNFRQTQVLRQWLEQQGYERPDHRHIEQIKRLLSARQHNSPQVSWAQTVVRLFDGRLYVTPPIEQPPKDWQQSGRGSQVVELPAGCGQLEIVGQSQTWVVRFRVGGETFLANRTLGLRKKLKYFFREQRVAPWQRQRVPLVFINKQLLAIGNAWQSRAELSKQGVKKIIWRPGLAD